MSLVSIARVGNTSTDVEKTRTSRAEPDKSQKHLHGRGEDASVLDGCEGLPETPPRTWRRLLEDDHLGGHVGNTSTDVEKTVQQDGFNSAAEKHLHGRGEDLLRPVAAGMCKETPPRTWRRLCDPLCDDRHHGNTSTDVEKTDRLLLGLALGRKHLHGRGEDSATPVKRNTSRETPPRTWRRRLPSRTIPLVEGNTSTDVEKTGLASCCILYTWKHLHGRGEDVDDRSGAFKAEETPPRTWRRQRPSALPTGTQ